MKILNWRNQILCGDNSRLLAQIPSSTVDLVVTSPPYDDIFAYGGHSWDFDQVSRQIARVLKLGGICVWVVADQVKKGKKTLTSFKQAIDFEKIGLQMHDVMIYEKSGSSFPCANRYMQNFEFMFVLSKGKPKTVNLIRDRPNKYVGKTGGNRRGGVIYREAFGTRFNIWRYSAGLYNSTQDHAAFKHPAVMPEQLALDHILSWSNEGDIVLDPFAGSGTVPKMALKADRQYCGIEINPEYIPLIHYRLNNLFK